MVIYQRKECSILMKTISNNKKDCKSLKKISFHLLSIIIWIVLWHIIATKLSNELFLPTPSKVFQVLFEDLLPSLEFRLSVKTSFLHIITGFVFGAFVGTLLAALSYICEAISVFLSFPIKIIKSIPVASFVVLTLLWCPSQKLSIFISFLVVFPIFYINTLEGLNHTDKKLLEMANLFKIHRIDKIKHIYIPQIISYLCSASSLAIGMAWKSGIAAEIIGLAKNSIGNQLYMSKVYLMTPELFAWTIVIIILSIICEQLIKSLTFLLLRRKD